MTRAALAASLLLGALASGSRTAAAQATTVGVNALVGDPVSITMQQALAFANVLPGVPKVVSPTAPGTGGVTPGIVTINGRHDTEIVVTFVFPSGNALRSGADAMPIDTWRGCWNTANNTAGCTAFVPSSVGSTMRFRPPGGGPSRIWVYVGATARPTGMQPAGTYSGTVSVSAAYTGL